MPDNYVEIKVKARDTAKPDLTALKAQLDALGAKIEDAKVNVDDKDAVARLTDLNAKLAALGKRVENPRLSVSGAARVEAQLAAIDAGLDHVGDKSAKADVKVGGLRSRLMALGSTAGTVSGLGDVFSVFSADASMATRVLSGFSLATGLLEAPLSGLIVGVGGLAAGLASAGAGLGIFSVVAKAAYANVTPAVTAYETAINTTGKASATAMKQYHAYMGALSGPQKEMARSVIGAKNAWNDFVSANTAGVGKIMSQGMGLLPKVFASMQPFMKPVETALHGIVTQLGHGLDSSGFKSFIDMMAKNSGPMITNLAGAIGHVVVGIGGILRAFMPMASTMTGGLDKITAKFAHWGQTLTQHSGFQSLVSMAKADMPMVIQIVKNLGAAIVNLGSSMTGLSTFSNSKALLQLAVPLSQLVNYLSQANPALLRMGLYALAAGGAFSKMKPAFQGIMGGISAIKGGVSAFGDLKAGFANSAAAASEATGVWGSVGGAISTAITAVKGWTIWSKIAEVATKAWTAVQIAFDAVMDANPIALVIIAVAALIGLIVLMVTHMHETAHIFDMVRHAGAAAFDAVRHAVAAVFDWIKAHWPLLLGILAGPFGIAAALIATHWKAIEHAVSSAVGAVRHAVASGWDAVRHSTASTFDNVRHTVSSKFDDVKHAVGSAMGWIHDHFRSEWNAVARVVDAAMVVIRAVVRTGVDFVKGIIRVGLDLIHGNWAKAGQDLRSMTHSIWNDIKGIIHSVISGLPGDLFRAGAHMVSMLASGIRSAIGAVGSAIGSIASEITSHLPFSPAKKGPLSGSGSPDKSGQKIAEMIAGGMDQGHAAVTGAAARMAGATRPGAAAGAAGGGQLHLILEVHGGGGTGLEQQFWTWFANGIRAKGGSPQIVTRKVSFG